MVLSSDSKVSVSSSGEIVSDYPVTLTGCPLNFVGLNFDARAAETAAARNRGCPETAEAEITLPCSSRVTCTVTEPDALTALAAGGYDGFAR